MKTFQFYLVSTPIGNVDDLSQRARDVLARVDFVLAEDTRTAKYLLGRFGITTIVRSFHDHNKERVTPAVIRELQSGKTAALVADAGTPCISDPGYYLVRRLIEAGIAFTSLPGASAVTTALVLSGLPPDRFTFFGYVPRKRGARERVLVEAGNYPGTAIFFESPRRLVGTLEEVARLLGDREVVVARELTKLHEEVVRGSAAELARDFGVRGVKGEVTLLIRGAGRRKRSR
jgi:16S rRNA (cytidine1402-2'-O)-methyltransferase